MPIKPESETAIFNVLYVALVNSYGGIKTWTPETITNLMNLLPPKMQVDAIMRAFDEVVTEVREKEFATGYEQCQNDVRADLLINHNLTYDGPM